MKQEGASLWLQRMQRNDQHVAASSPKPTGWAHPDEAPGQPVSRASTLEAGGRSLEKSGSLISGKPGAPG